MAKRLGLVAVLVGLLAMPCLAQEDEIQQQVDGFFLVLDTDKNNKINEKEIDAYVKKTDGELIEMMAVLLGADTDEDMVMTKDELKAFLALGDDAVKVYTDKDWWLLTEDVAKDAWQGLLKENDADGDGMLTIEESGDTSATFEAYDLNKDGKLDLEEFTTLSVAEAKKQAGVADQP